MKKIYMCFFCTMIIQTTFVLASNNDVEVILQFQLPNGKTVKAPNEGAYLRLAADTEFSEYVSLAHLKDNIFTLTYSLIPYRFLDSSRDNLTLIEPKKSWLHFYLSIAKDSYNILFVEWHGIQFPIKINKPPSKIATTLFNKLIIELVFVVDGTANTYWYAQKIKNTIMKIWDTVEQMNEAAIQGWKNQESPNPFLQELSLLDVVPKIRIAVIVYRDTNDVREWQGKLWSSEGNFWDFTESKQQFERNWNNIVFSGGDGDQASHRKALKSIFTNEFSFSFPHLAKKSQNTKLSWSLGSTRAVFLIGDVGQQDTLDKQWDAEQFINSWKLLPDEDRFRFLAVQIPLVSPSDKYWENPRNGYFRFRKFCSSVENGINAAWEANYASYVSLQKDDSEQQALQPLEKMWQDILEKIYSQQKAIYKLVNEGASAETDKYYFLLNKILEKRINAILTPQAVWSGELPFIPEKFRSVLQYDPKKQSLYLHKNVSREEKQELLALSQKDIWKEVIENLVKDQRRFNPNFAMGLYDEGWILEKNCLPELKARESYGAELITFSVFMTKTEFSDIYSILIKFVQAVKTFDQKVVGGAIEKTLKKELESILLSYFGNDLDSPLYESHSIVIKTKDGGSLLEMSINQIMDLSRAVNA